MKNEKQHQCEKCVNRYYTIFYHEIGLSTHIDDNALSCDIGYDCEEMKNENCPDYEYSKEQVKKNL